MLLTGFGSKHIYFLDEMCLFPGHGLFSGDDSAPNHRAGHEGSQNEDGNDIYHML